MLLTIMVLLDALLVLVVLVLVAIMASGADSDKRDDRARSREDIRKIKNQIK